MPKREVRALFDSRAVRGALKRSQMWVAVKGNTSEKSVRDYEADEASEEVKAKLDPVYDDMVQELTARYSP